MNDWQAVVVLHVSGPTVDPEALLKAFPVPGASSWRKGDKRPRRGVYDHGGFKATVVDADSQAALHRGLDRHLKECTGLYSELARHGERAFLDIGLMVPASHPLSLTFESELLQAFIDAGIVVTLTAYPCSEETAAQQ